MPVFFLQAQNDYDLTPSCRVIDEGSLDHAQLNLAVLADERFVLGGADMSQSIPAKADLTGAKLDHADLNGADLLGADLTKALLGRSRGGC